MEVLIVDDEPDIVESLRALLEGVEGVKVATATSFREGLRKAREHRWSIVIADHRLGDGSGVDLLAEVARAQPSATRVLISAYREFEMMEAAVNSAAIHHFFGKPFDPEAMTSWIGKNLKAAR